MSRISNFARKWSTFAALSLLVPHPALASIVSIHVPSPSVSVKAPTLSFHAPAAVFSAPAGGLRDRIASHGSVRGLQNGSLQHDVAPRRIADFHNRPHDLNDRPRPPVGIRSVATVTQIPPPIVDIVTITVPGREVGLGVAGDGQTSIVTVPPGLNFEGSTCPLRMGRGSPLPQFTIGVVSPTTQPDAAYFVGTWGWSGSTPYSLSGTITANSNGTYSITFTVSTPSLEPPSETYTGTLTPLPGGGWSMTVDGTIGDSPSPFPTTCVLSS
jgi:hypothetical protein